jgi:hypothetical protein
VRRELRQEVHYLNRFGVREHLEKRGYDRLNYRDWLYGRICALMIADNTEARELLAALDGLDWHT